MKLNNFCGCLSLKAGVILMGSLTLIWALLSLISVNALICTIERQYTSYVDLQLSRLAQVGITTYIIVIGATGALMIHGARKREPGFVFPWLARSTADLLIFCAATFTHIIISPMAMDLDTYFIILTVVLAAMALHVYIWLVIYSFYKQITVEKYSSTGACNEEKISKQPLNVYHHL